MTGLLGPNGQPISSQDFQNKKARPPALGTKYGQWAGPEIQFLQMPGGGTLAFDTSTLTLADLRQMKSHYQINSSLSVLTFMMHQMQWHIECEKQGLADLVEVQLRRVWSRLVRAKSQALWAGYGPSALEWENDYTGREVVLTKIKDLIPEDCRVHWKKETVHVPGSPAGAVTTFNHYDGIDQIGSPGPIPVECPTVETPILMADFSWKKAGDIEEGDVLLAFDEDERLKGRRYRKSLVEANFINTKRCLTIETRDGDPITVSEEHPFLVRRGPLLTGSKETSIYKDRWEWVKAKDLKVDDKIGFFGKPWGRDESRDAGYVAGIFDGEGHVNWYGGSVHIGFSQREGGVLQRTLAVLDAKGFEYTIQANTRDDCKEVRILGGRREIARFIEVFAPERLAEKVGDMFDDTVMRIEKSIGVTEVVGIFDAGEQQVASIQTETRTYISAGYLSHNCSYWYPLLMENGNYYGKRILESAFQPWFFSMLLHLFANRYYERFGEPTPVGRAPFEDTIDVNGTTMKGNQMMALVLQSLRNRSTVVLPTDKTPIGDETNPSYDYTIEYLESQMRGADFERYMTRLDEEMSLAMFTPILMMRTADVGSYNLGTQHTQVYQWMLNAISGDWADYINKYIIAPIVRYNSSTLNPPECKIVFSKMGKTSTELLQAIITQLLTADKIKFDVREIGEMTGLTIEEIETVTDTPEPPPAEEEPNPEEPDQKNEIKRLIVKRVRAQVEKGFRNGSFGSTEFQAKMGYKRQLSEAFKAEGLTKTGERVDDMYDMLDNWLIRTSALGVEEYGSADLYMQIFERKLEETIEVFTR